MKYAAQLDPHRQAADQPRHHLLRQGDRGGPLTRPRPAPASCTRSPRAITAVAGNPTTCAAADPEKWAVSTTKYAGTRGLASPVVVGRLSGPAGRHGRRRRHHPGHRRHVPHRGRPELDHAAATPAAPRAPRTMYSFATMAASSTNNIALPYGVWKLYVGTSVGHHDHADHDRHHAARRRAERQPGRRPADRRHRRRQRRLGHPDAGPEGDQVTRLRLALRRLRQEESGLSLVELLVSGLLTVAIMAMVGTMFIQTAKITMASTQTTRVEQRRLEHRERDHHDAPRREHDRRCPAARPARSSPGSNEERIEFYTLSNASRRGPGRGEGDHLGRRRARRRGSPGARGSRRAAASTRTPRARTPRPARSAVRSQSRPAPTTSCSPTTTAPRPTRRSSTRPPTRSRARWPRSAST